ncbi:MAG: catalase [Xanthomonadaceae bacterium]|nr:catalase [Xanthomonadaceae bacterium]
MATKKIRTKATTSRIVRAEDHTSGSAGELHQRAGAGHPVLTTNQGIAISDNQNSLRAMVRGPTLLEDFVLREKITHFDHERIPERIVHARGTGAHGYFELTKSLKNHTTANVLTDVGVRTPVFCRFSTVAGGAGSVDTPRDVRGFAVKFYTQQGNWDLVGNNIPVFFIQDAIKFPDLIHSVKMEPDRGFPQAASAHDTFWDFISLMPEALHMVLWAMSDRTLPRSLRMIEGFGVHSFRLVNAAGDSTFVKFHWRPKLGLQSTVWDEAVKIAGADSDFHRRDLFEAISRGDFPEWELAVQLFTDADAAEWPFDHLDPTKLIPEELVPLTVIGRMVLDRWPDNFFAETEQVAFCPANLVPGIDFSDDPLLQGRLFSYLDTQLSRLGGPNFHQLPINAPKCPFANLQRDGHMQMGAQKGRVNYEPNTLSSDSPRETNAGFRTYPKDLSGPKTRERSPSFADHYSQARMFYRSQSEIEQAHIVFAFVLELSKVEMPQIRRTVVAHLRTIDDALGLRVAAGLGMSEPPHAAPPIVPVLDLDSSPALRLIDKYPPKLLGRTIAILIDEGSDAKTVKALRNAIEKAGAAVKIVAPKIDGVRLSDGKPISVDGQLAGTPSVLFDAVALVLSPASAKTLGKEAAAIDFVRDAFGHLKAIAVDDGARALLKAAGIAEDRGVLAAADTAGFLKSAGARLWSREPKLRTLP